MPTFKEKLHIFLTVKIPPTKKIKTNNWWDKYEGRNVDWDHKWNKFFMKTKLSIWLYNPHKKPKPQKPYIGKPFLPWQQP